MLKENVEKSGQNVIFELQKNKNMTQGKRARKVLDYFDRGQSICGNG